MEINSTTSGNNDVTFVDADKIGFAGLNAQTFVKLLITELQNQDPLDPVGNEQLLNQLSMMQSLQSNVELSQTIKSLSQSLSADTSQNQLATAAGLIGKSVMGTNAMGQQVSGVVDRVFLREGAPVLGVGDQEVPLAQVASIRSA